MMGSSDVQNRPAPPEYRPNRQRRQAGRGPSGQARPHSSGSDSQSSSPGEGLLGTSSGGNADSNAANNQLGTSGTQLVPRQAPWGDQFGQFISSLPEPKPGEVKGREGARQGIVCFLCLMFAVTVGFAAYVAFKGGDGWKNLQVLLDLVFPVETALLGTAVAFYYTAN